MTEPKTPCEQLVHDMISGGARRVEAGETVRLPSGIAVTLRTGHGAVLGNRLVTTGAVETTRCERGQVAAVVREAHRMEQGSLFKELATACSKQWERAYVMGELHDAPTG